MLAKAIDELTTSDLHSLLEVGPPESQTLDYKRELPGTSSRDKNEFLADVTSFANATGGDLVYGVIEEEGWPREIPGLELADPEKARLRLQQLLRDSADPRLTACPCCVIQWEEGRYVIVLRIPQSWQGPHRVVATGRFHIREGRGKHEMDAMELRWEFTAGQRTAAEIRRFRRDRLTVINSREETPVPLQLGLTAVLHVVPLSAFRGPVDVDLAALHGNALRLPLWVAGLGNWWFNLDGFAVHGISEDDRAPAYTQAFRSGIIEAVRVLKNARDEPKYFPFPFLEPSLGQLLGQCLELIQSWEIGTPVYVMLSLLDARGAVMDLGNEPKPIGFPGHPLERSTVMYPEIELETLQGDPFMFLRPLLELLWQSFGIPRCPHYNENGDYTYR